MINRFETEEGRLEVAQAAGREQARFELSGGHTAPRDWSKDGNPYAGAYSHLAALGFTSLGCRTYALPFIDAYRREFPAAN